MAIELLLPVLAISRGSVGADKRVDIRTSFTALEEHLSIQASMAFSTGVAGRMTSMSEMEDMEDSGGGMGGNKAQGAAGGGVKRKAGEQASRGVEVGEPSERDGVCRGTELTS
jgi:hypothetical protein